MLHISSGLIPRGLVRSSPQTLLRYGLWQWFPVAERSLDEPMGQSLKLVVRGGSVSLYVRREHWIRWSVRFLPELRWGQDGDSVTVEIWILSLSPVWIMGCPGVGEVLDLYASVSSSWKWRGWIPRNLSLLLDLFCQVESDRAPSQILPEGFI